MLLSKTVELKRVIAQIINDDDKSGKFPKVITFSRGIEYPKFKITIEEIDEDFFVDSKGVKWVKAKDDDDEEDRK